MKVKRGSLQCGLSLVPRIFGAVSRGCCNIRTTRRGVDRRVLLAGMAWMMTATAMAATPYDRAAGWLAQCMDQYHSNVFVYADASCAGNHFSARGKMGDAANVLTMNEACTNHPFSGLTCIEAKFLANGSNWGGWYFMNGVLLGSETSPRENWGTYAHSGVNLQGAPRLKSRAKGRNGGERVEFFVGNVGRNEAGNPIASYPDSSSKATTGFITLSTVWEEHTIDLATNCPDSINRVSCSATKRSVPPTRLIWSCVMLPMSTTMRSLAWPSWRTARPIGRC